MFQKAYALFFLVVLVGSACALGALLRNHAIEVWAGLRGELPHVRDTPMRPRHFRIRSGRRPAFPPVRLSICRL
jgi:hypothetical protein